MPRRPAPFKQTDVTRALKAAQAAGLKPSRVEIDSAGRIVVGFDGAAPAEPSNPFDHWKAKRHARSA